MIRILVELVALLSIAGLGFLLGGMGLEKGLSEAHRRTEIATEALRITEQMVNACDSYTNEDMEKVLKLDKELKVVVGKL